MPIDWWPTIILNSVEVEFFLISKTPYNFVVVYQIHTKIGNRYGV